MSRLMQVRIPQKLDEEIHAFLESNGKYQDQSELMRQALREFFDKPQNPRRFDLALDAIYALVEKGPAEFAKKLRENGHE